MPAMKTTRRISGAWRVRPDVVGSTDTQLGVGTLEPVELVGESAHANVGAGRAASQALEQARLFNHPAHGTGERRRIG